ncbi:MAG TPA: DUF1517 domain-containing protein [Spirochaetota bacterium]|nr:DUF1517 domain-containing protein [Spirochaetota bacterium]HOM37681.1 DUF1517 domain-containing protein [Spirochaetota bacterium]HPQ49639.1 DUF1517 domain-containing protein [Spirochaetota bacterium]
MGFKRIVSLFFIIFFISTFIPTFLDARRGGGGGGFSSRSSSSSSRSSWSSSRSSWSSSRHYYGSSSDGGPIGIIIMLIPISVFAFFSFRDYIRRFRENPKEYWHRLKKILLKIVLNISILFLSLFLIGILEALQIDNKIGSATPFIIIVLILTVYLMIIINRKKPSRSLVSFQFGFYLGKGALVEEIKNIIKKADINKTSSLYNMFSNIVDFVIKNKESIRWFNYSIEKYRKDNELETAFNKKESEERAKYDVEEVVNIKGKKVEAPEDSNNLEEIFVLSIILGVFVRIDFSDKGFEDTLRLLKYCKDITIDNFGGVSVWYNIMDREELIETYPDIKSV